MDAIGAIAERHGVAVVEDNAHGLCGAYRGRPLGSFGALATLSFHETKNFACGEGGALVVNDARYADRAEVIWEKGTNRNRFFRGQVDKYTWVDVGSSHLPSDILAAFLFAQLEARAQVQARRRAIWERYETALGDWAAHEGVGLPVVPPHCQQPYHMFYVVLPDQSSRQALIDRLKAAGITAVFHYLPLHLSPMGRRFGGREGDCPVTEDVSDRLLRLPFYNELTDADQDAVIRTVTSFATRTAHSIAASRPRLVSK
jgi:dTDP-4-amino-4,6-dideoxygalactose transaminase